MKKILLINIIFFLTSCCSSRSASGQISNKMLDNFSNALRKDEGFQLVIHGGAISDGIIEEIILGYSTNRYLDISGARELIIKVSQDLIDFFNS